MSPQYLRVGCLHGPDQANEFGGRIYNEISCWNEVDEGTNNPDVCPSISPTLKG